jgi:dipeptidyl aminopeptidase/acylaminoacyl peptidase
VRNGVYDCACNVHTTDIQEWNFAATGTTSRYDPELLNRSPAFHIACGVRSPSAPQKLKPIAPTLFLVGGKDVRVPNSQSFIAYENLKSLNASAKSFILVLLYFTAAFFPFRLLFFPQSGHSLAEVETQGYSFVHFMTWFDEHSK